MLSQALRNGPRPRSAPWPGPCPPREHWRGFGGVGQVDSSGIQKVFWKRSPSHSGGGVGQRSRVRLRRVIISWCRMRRTKNPQGRHGLGALHGATLGAGRSDRRERPARKTVADADLQSALLMTKTAASSVVSVREPPAHTSTLHRIRAAAAISRMTLRMMPSTSDARITQVDSPYL